MDLLDKTKDYKEELELSLFSLDIPYVENIFLVFIDINACLVSAEVIVRGKLKIGYKLLCSRCLNSFEWVCLNDCFYEKQVKSDNQIIDLTPDIHEDIITALPMKPLCREECEGLCRQCGINFNVSKCDCDEEEVIKKSNPFENLEL